MKKLAIIACCIFSTITMFGQDITGDWSGLLKVQNIQLKLVFHITATDAGYTATMDSPDQGAKGIPVSSVIFEDPDLKLGLPNLGAAYEGKLEADSINGIFKQAGQSFPMVLKKERAEEEAPARPQEPKKPYPYQEEEVTFENKEAGITLAGTLTLPKQNGTFPAVILISGSGPQNRDEELFGHKPFLVLADHLTRQGFAVLRYDDRGVNKSTGIFGLATTKDFATDAMSALAYLKTRKEIDTHHIGLIGHSEGGIIAPMVAAQSKDVAFIVLLAGTGVPGKEISMFQNKANRPQGLPDEAAFDAFNQKILDIASSEKDLTTKRAELVEQLKSIPSINDAQINQQVASLLAPWTQFYLTYDPATALEKLNSCPVLSLNGSKDMQVPADMNQSKIREALEKAGNKDFLIKELPNLNHLFQECETGSLNEYATIEQTFAPVALEAITTWLKAHVK